MSAVCAPPPFVVYVFVCSVLHRAERFARYRCAAPCVLHGSSTRFKSGAALCDNTLPGRSQQNGGENLYCPCPS